MPDQQTEHRTEEQIGNFVVVDQPIAATRAARIRELNDQLRRTGRGGMVLMSNGIDAISVPAQRATDFNEKMVRFYLSKDATEMMAFLLECHPGE